MTDNPQKAKRSDAVTLPPRENFPPAFIPTVYAESAQNISPIAGVIKFYLVRFDPALDGSQNFITQPVAQVAMTMPGFIQMVTFFNQALDAYAKEGRIDAADLELIREERAFPSSTSKGGAAT
jgi:hypothetical protein